MTKNEVFEKVAKLEVETRKKIRKIRNHGDEEFAVNVTYEVFGFHNMLEALGYDLNEYAEYYKENRKRIRKELQ